jgi:hypothetical protein
VPSTPADPIVQPDPAEAELLDLDVIAEPAEEALDLDAIAEPEEEPASAEELDLEPELGAEPKPGPEPEPHDPFRPAPKAEQPLPADAPSLSWLQRLRRAWDGLWVFLVGGFGLLSALSIVAAIPVLQFATLGWLLEAEGRLARGEGWRSLLPGLRKAVPWGAGLLGCGLLAIPLLVLRSYTLDAQILDPASSTAITLARVTLGYGVFAGLYGLLALAAGRGKLWNFVRPFHNMAVLLRALADPEVSLRRELVGYVTSLRPAHYLKLGLMGFLVAAAWLGPPTLLLAANKRFPGLALLGALGLILVLRPALVAQARVAQEGRLGAGFELWAIRANIRRAPFSTALALVLTLGLALPLYLLKIELLPRDALWLPAGFFLLALWPGRVAAGWAQSRASQEGVSHWILRLVGLGIALPSAGTYVFFVFFNQFFGWRGAGALFAHHAYLLPVAFY